MFRISGRGVRNPYYRVDVSGSGVTVRIEDATNHELWLELTIPTRDLKQLLAATSASLSGCTMTIEPMPDEMLAPLPNNVEWLPPIPSAEELQGLEGLPDIPPDQTDDQGDGIPTL